MHLKYGLPAFKVGQFHLYAPVEAARTQQRLVESFGPVGGSKDYHTPLSVESVHLCKQLVESLFALVVARETAVASFSYSVNLVNEYYAWCLLVGLLEQIAHLCCTHAHEHLNKL